MSTTSDTKKEARKAFMEEAKAEGLTSFQKLTSLVYMTPPYVWFLKNVRGPLTGARSKERYSQHYHGKVLTLDQAEAIINIEQDIPIRDLEQVVPYDTARNFVLHAPADVALIECPCRRSFKVDYEPTQVCMVIGKPFTDVVMANWPRTSRRVTQEEALEVLEQEHERGHMHTAFFKDAMLNRFYVICNCNKDTCLGIRMMTHYRAPFLSPSGYSIRVDSATCNSCGKCADICPFDAILKDGRTIVNDLEKCMGCGVCVEGCPKNARKLVRDLSKGTPLDVRFMQEMDKQNMLRA